MTTERPPLVVLGRLFVVVWCLLLIGYVAGVVRASLEFNLQPGVNHGLWGAAVVAVLLTVAAFTMPKIRVGPQ